MPKGIYKRTVEHNRNISKALKGRCLSVEHRKRLSLAMRVDEKEGNKGIIIGLTGEEWEGSKSRSWLSLDCKEISNDG